MKRREFIAKGTVGAAGVGLSGCSMNVKRELSPHSFKNIPKKPTGTMPMSELGQTGIKVSRFGFGSHMRKDIRPFEKEREWMIREAHDLGINLFDVYDKEQDVFQYEPMGRFLKPVIKDVVISISINPWEGRTLEQEFERDLRLFGRDYIDMVRIHSYSSDSDTWYQWEKLFKYKEQGKIRAVGIPIHQVLDLKEPLEQLPLDYVIFPFNYYHNWTWAAYEKELGKPEKCQLLIPELRKRNMGVITMKPFAGDNLAYPFRRLGAEFDPTGEVNVSQASLRYVINSGLDIDTTLGGMYYPYHVYENAEAYFNPEMTDEERNVLKKIRNRAKIVAKDYLEDRYAFLEDWVPESFDDSDLQHTRLA